MELNKAVFSLKNGLNINESERIENYSADQKHQERVEREKLRNSQFNRTTNKQYHLSYLLSKSVAAGISKKNVFLCPIRQYSNNVHKSSPSSRRQSIKKSFCIILDEMGIGETPKIDYHIFDRFLHYYDDRSLSTNPNVYISESRLKGTTLSTNDCSLIENVLSSLSVLSSAMGLKIDYAYIGKYNDASDFVKSVKKDHTDKQVCDDNNSITTISVFLIEIISSSSKDENRQRVYIKFDGNSNALDFITMCRTIPISSLGLHDQSEASVEFIDDKSKPMIHLNRCEKHRGFYLW